MGEKENKPFQLTFEDFSRSISKDRESRWRPIPETIRELVERLGLGKLIDEHLTDSRQGSNETEVPASSICCDRSEVMAGWISTTPFGGLAAIQPFG